MTIETIQVIWKNKFNGQPVTINKTDFDAAIHQLPGSAEAGTTVTNTPLPDDFPGVISLREAGLVTYESLADKTLENLTAIKGIGNSTGQQILAALAAK